jgi:methylenetetrahydrofolate dehydrogenase (NADP+) / methenyltetrahydrofolate cyclohydrolase
VTALLADGNATAASVLEEVAARVARRLEEGRRRPHLAAVLVGDDAASETYVRMKRRDCERVGIESSDHRLRATASTADVVALVDALNREEAVSGILVQQPLPPQVDLPAVVEAVDPAKDVDGFHPVSAGRLLLGQPGLRPCTPAGILLLLERAGIAIEGQRAVVVGRSNIVGKPVALMLLARHATVTVCHTRTPDLAAVCREADILVVAGGRPALVGPQMVRAGAAVVDVGINRVDGRVVGDVDPRVAEVAGWLTPVPGGVGPMTRAMLVRNTLAAEEARPGP